MQIDLFCITLESNSKSNSHNLRRCKKDCIKILERIHTSEIESPKPSLIISAKAYYRDACSCSDVSFFAFGILFRAAIYTHTKTNTEIHIDIWMMKIREAYSRHKQNIVEIVPRVPTHLATLAITHHISPPHITEICKGTIRKPIVRTMLILKPYVLVVVVVLMVCCLIRLRHSINNMARAMPHKTLEELVTPPYTKLVSHELAILLGLSIKISKAETYNQYEQ